MAVLMLGWEYPPFITGGLGTACEGLTKGLSRQGVNIIFVIPRLQGGQRAGHMHLVDAQHGVPHGDGTGGQEASGFVEHVAIDALLGPYWRAGDFQQRVRGLSRLGPAAAGSLVSGLSAGSRGQSQYGFDIYDAVTRYAAEVVATSSRLNFDLIHAHDWMTYPAAVALSQRSRKPLIVHIHSLERDRSGMHIDRRIHDIEGGGLRAADAVIAVSHYTKSLVHSEYGVPLDRIHVVHNGICPKPRSTGRDPADRSKTVLYLGRVTFQKGPDYFLKAAAKVIPHVPEARFVMAGSGDMLDGMMRLARDLGIQDHVTFPGFLKDRCVEEALANASLYVLPSVSEPFGISVLEAIDVETPTLISRQSGVSEVVAHTLRFDFWDVDRLADLIINGLVYEELRSDMVAMAKQELSRLHWDASAKRTMDVYRRVA